MEHKNGMGCRVQIRKMIKWIMTPSVSQKIVLVNVIMIITILVIFFKGFSDFFREYCIDNTFILMEKQAKVIEEEFQKGFDAGLTKDSLIQDITEYISILDDYLESNTWIIDSNGECVIFKKDSINETNKKIPVEYKVEDVFDGEMVRVQYAFEDYTKSSVIALGYPLVYNNEVRHAIYINTAIDKVLESMDNTRSMGLVLISILILVMIAFRYTMYRQITKPLKQMNEVAKTIASGHFGERLVVKGKDEVADLAQSFNHMAEELNKIEEKRKGFIANISHDLRSPLTSIQGFIIAILDGTISKENQEKYLNIVLSETRRMIGMTNDILELSKTEDVTRQINKEVFDIHDIIDASLTVVENRAKETNISLTKTYTSSSGYVLADKDDINRVIQNLLDNALKFVGENGFVEVRTAIRGKRLWVAIYNSGPHIPKHQQAEIWNRFYKADASRGKDKAGIGLGLVIVKEIIRQHGEIVGVHSEEGEPVIFYFSLTLSK